MSQLFVLPMAPVVFPFDEHTQSTLNRLWGQWAQKQPGNFRRLLYMDAQAQFQDLEVAIPPSLADKLNVVFGWPEKAVYEISNRIVLEDYVSPDNSDDPFSLAPVLRANRFWTEFPDAVVSSCAQSVAFVSVTPGQKENGEPEQIVMFHSALYATGLWNRRTRRMDAALIIQRTDALGAPVQMMLMLPSITYNLRDSDNGWFVETEHVNVTRRLMFHALPYRPNLDRPFGKARIDRVTMSLTDRAVRAGGRLEVHSELFATLKMMLMGADASTFKDSSGNTIPLWDFSMSRVNGVPRDEWGDIPKLETIVAQSPEPHIATLREIASEFSGHSGVPLSALGVSSANPESADAKRVGREDIVNDAERQQLVYEATIRNVFEDIVMLRENLTEPPAEMGSLEFLWRPAERTTKSADADAGAKQVASIEGLSGTRVGMEMVGMTRSQIDRAERELRGVKSRSLIEALVPRRPLVEVTDGDLAS